MLCMRVAAPVPFFMRPQRIKKKQNTTLVYKVLYFVCYAIYIGGGSEYFRSEIKFFFFFIIAHPSTPGLYPPARCQGTAS